MLKIEGSSQLFETLDESEDDSNRKKNQCKLPLMGLSPKLGTFHLYGGIPAFAYHSHS